MQVCIHNSLELSRYKAADGEFKRLGLQTGRVLFKTTGYPRIRSPEEKLWGKNSFLVCIYRE